MSKRKKSYQLSLDSGSYSVTGSPTELIGSQPTKPAFYLAEDYQGPKSGADRRHLLECLEATDSVDYSDAQKDSLWQIKLQKEKARAAHTTPGVEPNGESAAGAPGVQRDESNGTSTKKRKRSTVKGEARVKLIAALSLHHK